MDGANEVGGPPRSRVVTLGTSRLFVALLLPGLIVFAWVGIKDSGLWTARSAVPLGMGIVLTWRLAVAGVFVTDDEVRVVNLLRVRSVHRECRFVTTKHLPILINSCCACESPRGSCSRVSGDRG